MLLQGTHSEYGPNEQVMAKQELKKWIYDLIKEKSQPKDNEVTKSRWFVGDLWEDIACKVFVKHSYHTTMVELLWGWILFFSMCGWNLQNLDHENLA